MIHKTVREIAAAWKEYKRPYVKQSTMAAYVLILENHVLPYFGDGDSIHEQAVQAFVLQKLGNGLSVKTVPSTRSWKCCLSPITEKFSTTFKVTSRLLD